MVEKAFVAFVGLVALLFILTYPERIVELLQLVIDAAQRVVEALANLQLKNK